MNLSPRLPPRPAVQRKPTLHTACYQPPNSDLSIRGSGPSHCADCYNRCRLVDCGLGARAVHLHRKIRDSSLSSDLVRKTSVHLANSFSSIAVTSSGHQPKGSSWNLVTSLSHQLKGSSRNLAAKTATDHQRSSTSWNLV